MESYEATKVRMERAWSMVCPTKRGAKDWREPVFAFVRGSELEAAGTTVEEVAEAVAFMTATEAKVERFEFADGTDVGYRVSAVGYRRGPAGP